MLKRLFGKGKCVKPPIFIIGVPRSGTTLLRVLFDSHPNIACGPEAPWLARGASSIKNLYCFMADDRFGYVQNYDVSKDAFKKQVSSWVNNLFMTYASGCGKGRWAEKTPDHSLEIPFLAELFPDAYFVHIIRDGRDVACSTAILSEERKAMSEWHATNLLLSDGVVVPNTLQNAALRWQKWLTQIEIDLKQVRNSRTIRYEDLVNNPEQELRRLLTFTGEEFSSEMLCYMEKKHDYPDWEWGSRDVNRSNGISIRSVRRWEKQLDQDMIHELDSLIGVTLRKYNYN